MASDKPKLVTGITPKGVAGWPKLNVPDEYQGKKTYKTNLTLNAEDSAGLIEKINKETDKCVADTKAKLELTIKEGKTGDAKAKAKKALAALTTGFPYVDAVDEEGNETGDYLFKFKSNADFKDKSGKVKQIKVPLFDAKGKPTSASIWGGSVIRVAYALVPYYVASANQCGISLRITGVKVIELRSAGGGYSADSLGLGEEEDGYESSSMEGDESTESADDSSADPDEVDDF